MKPNIEYPKKHRWSQASCVEIHIKNLELIDPSNVNMLYQLSSIWRSLSSWKFSQRTSTGQTYQESFSFFSIWAICFVEFKLKIHQVSTINLGHYNCTKPVAYCSTILTLFSILYYTEIEIWVWLDPIQSKEQDS